VWINSSDPCAGEDFRKSRDFGGGGTRGEKEVEELAGDVLGAKGRGSEGDEVRDEVVGSDGGVGGG